MNNAMPVIRIILLACCLLSLAVPAAASDAGRNVINLSLEKAIDLACMQSVDAAIAGNQLKSSYWEFRTYRAERLPELVLSGNLPDYSNNFTPYQHDDGSYSYVRNNLIGISGALSITQNIPFTGGTLSLSTSLDLTRQLGHGAMNEFLAIPVSLTLNQPLFGVNTFKWDKKIEPVKYEEAKAQYLQNVEEIKKNAITYFFNYLLSAENLGIAEQNMENADRLYVIALEKRRMGQISETELMQLKLSALQAKADVTACQSDVKSKMFQLRAFLGLSENDSIAAELPDKISVGRLEYADVLDKAIANNPFTQNILRRQLEADYEVAAAKGERYRIDLTATIGYSGTNRTLSGSYGNLGNEQIVSVGLSVPILDWGKRKGEVKVAESNRDVVESQIRQDRLNFNQDVFLIVEQFNNQAGQLSIAEEADKIASERYKSSVEAFLLGKMDVLELNDARDAKDEARRKYISEMYYYWYYFYDIRALTLWDYMADRNIRGADEAIFDISL